MAGRHDTRQKMEQEWKVDSSPDKYKTENKKMETGKAHNSQSFFQMI